jgi:hypothetical protein
MAYTNNVAEFKAWLVDNDVQLAANLADDDYRRIQTIFFKTPGTVDALITQLGETYTRATAPSQQRIKALVEDHRNYTNDLALFKNWLTRCGVTLAENLSDAEYTRIQGLIFYGPGTAAERIAALGAPYTGASADTQQIIRLIMHAELSYAYNLGEFKSWLLRNAPELGHMKHETLGRLQNYMFHQSGSVDKHIQTFVEFCGDDNPLPENSQQAIRALMQVHREFAEPLYGTVLAYNGTLDAANRFTSGFIDDAVTAMLSGDQPKTSHEMQKALSIARSELEEIVLVPENQRTAQFATWLETHFDIMNPSYLPSKLPIFGNAPRAAIVERVEEHKSQRLENLGKLPQVRQKALLLLFTTDAVRPPQREEVAQHIQLGAPLEKFEKTDTDINGQVTSLYIDPLVQAESLLRPIDDTVTEADLLRQQQLYAFYVPPALKASQKTWVDYEKCYFDYLSAPEIHRQILAYADRHSDDLSEAMQALQTPLAEYARYENSADAITGLIGFHSILKGEALTEEELVQIKTNATNVRSDYQKSFLEPFANSTTIDPKDAQFDDWAKKNVQELERLEHILGKGLGKRTWNDQIQKLENKMAAVQNITPVDSGALRILLIEFTHIKAAMEVYKKHSQDAYYIVKPLADNIHKKVEETFWPSISNDLRNKAREVLALSQAKNLAILDLLHSCDKTINKLEAQFDLEARARVEIAPYFTPAQVTSQVIEDFGSLDPEARRNLMGNPLAAGGAPELELGAGPGVRGPAVLGAEAVRVNTLRSTMSPGISMNVVNIGPKRSVITQVEPFDPANLTKGLDLFLLEAEHQLQIHAKTDKKIRAGGANTVKTAERFFAMMCLILTIEPKDLPNYFDIQCPYQLNDVTVILEAAKNNNDLVNQAEAMRTKLNSVGALYLRGEGNAKKRQANQEFVQKLQQELPGDVEEVKTSIDTLTSPRPR